MEYLNNIKILVAEDDEMCFLLIETILSEFGIRVIHASNGDEAVEILKQQNDIRLILMDMRMPVKDGLEATKEIRSFDNAIPIIAQTAFNSYADKKSALNAGCNDYLTKPLSRNLMLSLIQTYVK
jgi:CheY-like chemotaxis protein